MRLSLRSRVGRLDRQVLLPALALGPDVEHDDAQQSLLPVEDIRARSKVLDEFAGFPEETVTEHFECGYYDAGARRKDPRALIQAGCFLQARQRRIVDPEIHALSPGSGHVLVAKAEAIPAGVQVVADGDWPEVMALLGVPREEGGVAGGNPPAR